MQKTKLTGKKKRTDEQIRLDRLRQMSQETRELIARCERMIKEMRLKLHRAAERIKDKP